MMRRLSTAFFFSLIIAGPALAAPPGDFYWATTDFQVACDGMDPDTTELNAALAMVASTGGTLVLPAGGECIYDGLLTIGGSHWVIEGNGATLVLDDAATGGGLLIADAAHFEIRNLVLDGSAATQGIAADQLTIDRSHDGFLIDVRTVGSPADGFRLQSDGAEPMTGVRTRDIQLVSCSAEGSHGDGLRIVEAAGVLVLGGSFVDSGAGASAGNGIRIEGTTLDETIADVLISGVSIRGSSGVGVDITKPASTPSDIVTNVRVVDADLSDDDGGALRIDAGDAVEVRGTLIHDLALSTQQAGVLITDQAGDVSFRDNHLRAIETGDPAIWVQSSVAGPGVVTIADNRIADVNVTTTVTPTNTAALLHEADDGVIRGNDLVRIGFRGILTRGERTLVAGNELAEMTENVMLINGVDSVVIDNVVSSLMTPSTVTSAGKSVVRIREPDNIVRGNSLICSNTLQRAYHFDEGAALVTNNTVDECAAGNQGDGIHFGMGSAPVFANNAQY